MPFYQYKATSMEGEVVEGVLNAPDEKAVVAKLKNSRLLPIKISRSKEKAPRKVSNIDAAKMPSGTRNPPLASGRGEANRHTQSANSAEIITFTTELAALLGAGLPLDRSLHILSEISEKSSMQRIVTEVLQSIREGSSFSDALMKHPKAFPRIYVNVVRAGELGGVIEGVMQELTEFLESAKDLKDSVVSSMIYPVLLALSGSASIIILLTYVIPKFSTIFEDLGQTMPLPTQMIISVSDAISTYWWIVILSVSSFIFLFRQFINTESGRLWWDSLKLKLMREIVSKLETARFCRTLGTLLKSGVPLLQALRNVQDVVGNVIFRNHITSVIKGAKEGKGITKPIINSGVFPALAVSMIKVGEETGQLDAMLLKVADTFEKSLRSSVKRFVNILEPALILIMGIVVGFIVMSMLLAIFSINDLPL